MPTQLTPEQRRVRARAFIAFMQKEIPGCRIKFKDDPAETIPWKDRFAHAVARLIVPGYDTRFTTVLHPIIYFPSGSRDLFEQYPERFYSTLRHEFVHLKDFQRFHVWFMVSYSMILPMFWTMRSYWEMRGYAQNMIVRFEENGVVPDEDIEHIARLFSSRDYVFMLSPHRRARRMLLELREQVLEGRLSGIYPYAELKNPLPDELRSGAGQDGWGE